MPSAVAGALSIYFSYIYTKRYFEENIAIMASTLIALSYVAIYYSQEARSYSFLILFSIISTFLWLQVMFDSKLNKIDFIKYFIVITITSYIHYFGLLLITIQLLYWYIYSIYYFRNIRRPMLASLALMLLYAPWLYIVYEYTMGLTGGEFWITKPGIRFFTSYISWLFQPRLLSIVLLIVAPFLIDYNQHIKNILDMVKNNLRLNSPLFALSYLLFVPTILSYFISLHTPILTQRNLLIVAPILYILVAIWISKSAINKNKQVSYVFFSCLICLSLFLPDYYANPHKQQWREAVDYTIQNATDSVLVVTTSHIRAGLFNYYFEKHLSDPSIKAEATV
jgi:mannosyltransferase